MKTVIKFLYGHMVAMCNMLLLMGGLIYLMASCDTQYIPDDPDEVSGDVSAKEGNFKLNIRIANYGEQADTLSSLHSMESKADTLPLTPETNVIRVKDDLFIYATLAVDTVDRTPAVKTRAFTVNSRIRVVGFRVDPGPSYVQVFDEVYKVVDNTGTLTRESSPDLIVLPVAKYKLVAYSYNDIITAPPAYQDTIKAIDPVNDLLWGISDTVTVVNGVDNKIPITIAHKLSQVKLVATTGGPGGPAILDFSNVKMPGYLVDLATFTGAVSKNITTDQNFTFTVPGVTQDTVKSNTRTVYTGTPGDDPTVVQIGSMTVQVTTLKDTTITDFSAAFAKSLKSGYSYTMTMRIGDNPNLTDNIPTGFLTYVGAFWKHDQTGERLIRMPRMTTGVIDSVWTAQVIEGKDWILLDKVMTTDPNVGWRSGANESAVDDANQLSFENNTDRQLKYSPTASTFVSGFVRASGSASFQPGDDQIYFRIGLKDKYTPTTDKPVRYGIVLLTYANNTRRHRIWIRQGEDPDYLMRPGNTSKSGTAVAGGRPNAVRFSPYNLTDPNKNSVNNYTLVPELGTNANNKGGVFVDYPSKAGYLFQWNLTTRAFHPTIPISNWANTGGSNTWVAAATETCPKGYRRPNDGDPTAGAIATSEMRQSLWVNSVGGTVPSDATPANALGNVVFGYYADGYFDRRQIVQGVTATPALLTAVASPGAEVAYRGMLYYNQFNNASLFFPATGFLDDNGLIQQAGKSGHAWTRTSNAANPLQLAYDPDVTPNAVSHMATLSSYQGLTIRCVYDPSYVLPSAIAITDTVSSAPTPISNLLFVSGPAANDPVNDPNGLAPRNSTRPDSQYFKVTWENPNNTLAVIKTTPAGTTPFLALPADWATYVNPSLNLTTLAAPSPRIFKVRPPAFTAAEITAAGGYPADKITEVKFVVTNGAKQDTASITLTHRYYHFSAIPLEYAYTAMDGTPRDSWTLDGLQDTIQVKSNVRWRIKSIVGDGASVDGGVYNPLSSYTQLFQNIGNLQVGHEGGSNAGPTTENIILTTINAHDTWGGVTITFESPDGYFQDYTMSVVFALPETRLVGLDNNCCSPNPYGYAVRIGSVANKMINSAANFGLVRGFSTVYSRGFTANLGYNEPAIPAYPSTAPYGASPATTFPASGDLNQASEDQVRALMNKYDPHILAIGYNFEILTSGARSDSIISIIRKFLNRGGVLLFFMEDPTTATEIMQMVFGTGTTLDATVAGINGPVLSGYVYQLIDNHDNDIVTNGPFSYANPGDPRGKFWGNDATPSVHITGVNTKPGVHIYSGSSTTGGTTMNGISSFSYQRTTPDIRNVFFVGDGGFISSGAPADPNICPFQLDAQGRPKSKLFGTEPTIANTQRNVDNAAFFGNIMLWGFSRLDNTVIQFR